VFTLKPKYLDINLYKVSSQSLPFLLIISDISPLLRSSLSTVSE